MSTATEPVALTTPPPKRSRPSLDAVCEWMATDWSPWHVVLSGLTWADYQRLKEARSAAGRKAVRITYDRGVAEVYTVGWGHSPTNRGPLPGPTEGGRMTVGNRHERWKSLIGRLLEAIALARRTPLIGAGNVTISREDLDRGFEPDTCYYVRNAAHVLEVRELDFRHDPPPDLAIEIEISQEVVECLPLYAAMGVPEVWRWDGGRLTVLHRTPAGEYTEATASLAFPVVPPTVLASYLSRAGTVDDTTLCLELFRWAEQLPSD